MMLRPLFVLALAASFFVPGRLSAATFNIANGDVYGVNGLVAALNASNSNNQDDTINLAAGGLYTLTVVNNTTQGNNGLPVIAPDGNHALTINGNGSVIERSTAGGTPTLRIFLIACTVQCATKQTTLNDLTIRRGAAVTGSGGAIRLDFDGRLTLNNCVLANNLANVTGGGLSNGGRSVSLSNCTFTDNQADEGGGAVVNSTSLTALNCTFNGNNTISGPGGALYNFGNSATADVTNCTFDDNTRNPGGGSQGGGIFNNINASGAGATSAIMTLTHCTLNQTDVLNSGIYTGGDAPTGLLTVRNCLFNASGLVNSTNPGHDRVRILSSGYNLSSGDGGGNLTGPNDQINTNPRLDPAGLQDNGGLTDTFTLLAESPAIDRGQSFGVATDQRGQIRPRNLPTIPNGPGSDGSDIGALEVVDPTQGGPTFVVNLTADDDDGVCGLTDCTLREALAAANAASDANTITFAANVTGTITVSASLGQFVASNPVTINGPGARVLALSGGNARRVLNFSSGTNVLSGLTIRDGRFTALSSTITAAGGGVSNSGTLTVSDCAFLNNQIIGGPNSSGGIFGSAGGSGRGGAISNGGVLTVNRSTFTGNSATGGRGFTNTGVAAGGTGGFARGAGIANDSTATLTVNNCTFTSNTATGGPGGNNTDSGARGGNGGAATGAAVFNAGTTMITASTISGNTGVGGAGGLGSEPRNDGDPGQASGGVENNGDASSTLRNTLNAGNTGNAGPDVKGTFVSQGFNLIGAGDFATGFTQTGDQVGTTAAPINAMLGSLQNNGGPTDTVALLTNSPAIDRGNAFGLTTDQRGLGRDRDLVAYTNAAGGDGTDIGAFELSAGVPVLSVVSRKAHGASGTFDLAIPITGATGVECRTGGAGRNHQLVLTFPAAVTVGGLSLVSSDGLATGGFTVAGSTVTLNLSAVADAQTLGITLNNVTMGATTGSVQIALGVLLGDTTRNGSVSSSDVSLVKSLSGQTVSASNAAADVTANGGAINTSDIATVKAQAGMHLDAATLDPDEKAEAAGG